MAQQESMFGPTPLAIQDQLDQQFLQRNSNLDLGSMSARAGLAIGNGINGLLGREDPRVRQAKTMEEVKNELKDEGVDPSKPDEFYPALIKKLNSKGLTEQAMSAANAYRAQGLSAAKTASEIGKNNAAAYASMREKLSPIGKLQAEYADAVARGDDKKAKELQDAINLANQGNLEKTVEGVPGKEGWQREVLRTRDGKLVHEGEPYKKPPLVDQSTKAENDFYLKTGGENAKAWDTQFQTYKKIAPTIKGLEQLINNEKLITGAGADTRVEMLRFASLLGFTTEAANKLIDNNDMLKTFAINIVLPKMKELSGSDSNEELRQLLAAGANANITPEVMRRQIKLFKEQVKEHAKIGQAVQEDIEKNKRPPAEAWYRYNKGASADLFGSDTPESAAPPIPTTQAVPTQPKPPAKPALKAPPGVDIEAAKAQYRVMANKEGRRLGWSQDKIDAEIKKNLGE